MRAFLAAALAAGALSVPFALPAPASAQSVLEACAEDIATYCASVEPGHGRIAACLYAHETTISEGCDAATGETSDILDTFFARLREVYEACGPDAARFCSDVETGGGRVLACLKENESEIESACAAVIDRAPLPTDG
ncbi:MAG: cysteine rich repeat-containing protein [Pseudomonadota bacterium]